MNVIHFISVDDLPILHGFLWGPHSPRRRERRLRLVMDTGAAMTIITPTILQVMGYGAQHREAKTVIRSAVGEERGFVARIRRFRCLGVDFLNLPIHEHALGGSSEIDGLLGWDILRRFNLDVRPRERHMVVSQIVGDHL